MTRESEENWPKRGRGRPREEGAYRHSIRVRLDDRDIRRLDILSDVTGDTRSDVVRIAVEGYYNYLRREGVIK